MGYWKCTACGRSFSEGGSYLFCPACKAPRTMVIHLPKLRKDVGQVHLISPKEIREQVPAEYLIGKHKKGGSKMPKKLYGAAAKAHAKKMARGGTKKTRKTTKAKGGMIAHKAYQYTTKKGKTVHVKAHTEHHRR